MMVRVVFTPDGTCAFFRAVTTLADEGNFVVGDFEIIL